MKKESLSNYNSQKQSAQMQQPITLIPESEGLNDEVISTDTGFRGFNVFQIAQNADKAKTDKSQTRKASPLNHLKQSNIELEIQNVMDMSGSLHPFSEDSEGKKEPAVFQQRENYYNLK